MGLALKRHSRQAYRAGCLVANTAGMARPIVAVAMRTIAQASLGVIGAALFAPIQRIARIASQQVGIAQSHVAVMGGRAMLSMGGMAFVQGDAWATVRGICMVLAHRHPDVGQQPQGHQAKQETNEQSAHGQIISHGLKRQTCGRAAFHP